MTDQDYCDAKNAESVYGGFAVQQARFRQEIRSRKSKNMKTTMRAKMQVQSVKPENGIESLEMMAVTSKPFNPDGESEDNTYARWTPSGVLKLSITNPALHGKFKPGQKFYLDFTEAPE